MEFKETDRELEETVQETETPEEVTETETPEEVTETEETVAAEKPASEPAAKAKKAPAQVTFTVSLWKIIVATVVMVLLLVVLVGAIIYGITGELPYNLGAKETTAAPTAPVGTTAPPRTAEELGMTIEGITDRASYTDEAAAAAANEQVVATIGEYSLTNGQLQVFYWMALSEFAADAAESGYDLMNDYKLDISKPLDQQLVIQSEVTWEQFFLHNAMGTWWRYVAMNIMADDAQFVMTDSDRASLDSVAQQLEEDAKKQGFENAEAMMRDRMGEGCTVEDFLYYMELTARGDLYATQFQTTYTPTDEEIESFYDQNAEYYAYYGPAKDAGKPVSVRHVLLVPEGATQDASTGHVTATDEQWAAGMAAAQAMLDAWVAEGATEEGFAALAKEHSTDGGSQSNGGLYENVTKGQMVANFDAWIFDETREPGNYGIVKTEFGHHLMYFVTKGEQDAWYTQAKADCMTYGYCLNNRLAAAMDANAMTPVLENVVLTDVSQEPTVAETTDPTAATE